MHITHLQMWASLGGPKSGCGERFQLADCPGHVPGAQEAVPGCTPCRLVFICHQMILGGGDGEEWIHFTCVRKKAACRVGTWGFVSQRPSKSLRSWDGHTALPVLLPSQRLIGVTGSNTLMVSHTLSPTGQGDIPEGGLAPPGAALPPLSPIHPLLFDAQNLCPPHTPVLLSYSLDSKPFSWSSQTVPSVPPTQPHPDPPALPGSLENRGVLQALLLSRLSSPPPPTQSGPTPFLPSPPSPVLLGAPRSPAETRLALSELGQPASPGYLAMLGRSLSRTPRKQ